MKNRHKEPGEMMRILLVLLLGCLIFSVCSCYAAAPNDKYPYGRDEIRKEHEEVFEGRDRR